MHTERELRDEIAHLESIKIRFSKDDALYWELVSIINTLNYAIGNPKYPTPSKHILDFLDAKDNQRPSGGRIWLPNGYTLDK